MTDMQKSQTLAYYFWLLARGEVREIPKHEGVEWSTFSEWWSTWGPGSKAESLVPEEQKTSIKTICRSAWNISKDISFEKEWSKI